MKTSIVNRYKGIDCRFFGYRQEPSFRTILNSKNLNGVRNGKLGGVKSQPKTENLNGFFASLLLIAEMSIKIFVLARRNFTQA